jgi:hypothetical protein
MASICFPFLNTGQMFAVFHDINITVSGVEKLLSKLNPTKAAGPDNITPRVLKELLGDAVTLVIETIEKHINCFFVQALQLDPKTSRKIA